jgi:hypothetical protein
MRYATAHLAAAGLSALFGLGFLLLPLQMGALYGMETDAVGVWLGRYFGLALCGLAVVLWVARSVIDAGAQRRFAIAGLAYSALGVLVALWSVFSPAGTPMLWVTVAVYAVLAVSYALALGRG